MTARASIVLVAAMLASACATPLLKLPTGPGAPAADAAEAITQALKTCRGISTISAALGVNGTVGGRRARGRLAIGLGAPALAYIEAPAPFGAPVFVFASVDGDATLLLPRDRRVLQHGDPAQVLEAIAGVALAPADLRAALTGCADTNATGAQQAGDGWRVVQGQPELYLHRERTADSWRLVAAVHRPPGGVAWRAEYRDFLGDSPRTIRLTSLEPRRFDLLLALSQVEINVPLGAETFRIRIPADAVPMTIDDLRRTGPLTQPPPKSHD